MGKGEGEIGIVGFFPGDGYALGIEHSCTEFVKLAEFTEVRV
ncbi:hypothetical protein [Calothrix sp. 336/3]|nr:hypothetical protein [Calothrix sp. 336/3]